MEEAPRFSLPNEMAGMAARLADGESAEDLIVESGVNLGPEAVEAIRDFMLALETAAINRDDEMIIQLLEEHTTLSGAEAETLCLRLLEEYGATGPSA